MADPFLEQGSFAGAGRYDGLPAQVPPAASTGSQAAPWAGTGTRPAANQTQGLPQPQVTGYGAFKAGAGDPRAAGSRVGERRGVRFHILSVAALVLVPWTAFTLACCSSALLHFRHPTVARLLAVICLSFVAILVMANFKNRRGPIYLYLAGLSIIALGLGWVTGLRISDRHMMRYWSPNMRPTYNDVNPRSSAAAYEDAGFIRFSSATQLDLQRVMGARAEDGDIYCVVPILDDVQSTKVNFWAAGVDCCEPRQGFHCGDAELFGTRSGVLMAWPEVNTPGENSNTMYAKLLKVARQSAAAFQLDIPDHPIFVSWVKDVDQTRTIHFHATLLGIFLACLFFLGVSICVGAALHWSTGVRRADFQEA
mmetsp:Transcript_33754/g.73879  ORF Transcript_33754/g.73879 Transcript_33754/m.73879 type:complete len:367 (-) Transcript_33754:125-1225(-)